jgi:hypothetical protein
LSDSDFKLLTAPCSMSLLLSVIWIGIPES